MNTSEQLEQINKAITAIESGCQEYSINGRRFVRPDISTLYAPRSELQSQLASEQNGGFGQKTYIVKFNRR